MNTVKWENSGEDFEELLRELETLFRQDPTDRAPAMFILTLLEQRRIDFQMARNLYARAIERVYFQ